MIQSVYQSRYLCHQECCTCRTRRTYGSDRFVGSRQNALIKVAREKQSKTDHHALVKYDTAVTEYPINFYVLFTPPVGRSDKFLPRVVQSR